MRKQETVFVLHIFLNVAFPIFIFLNFNFLERGRARETEDAPCEQEDLVPWNLKYLFSKNLLFV